MDSLKSIFYGIQFGNYEKADKVGRTTTNGYTVDTCDTVDQGWETAVWYGENEIVIVERYADKETATQGHAKWVEFCKGNPTEVWSVQFDRMRKLR